MELTAKVVRIGTHGRVVDGKEIAVVALDLGPTSAELPHLVNAHVVLSEEAAAGIRFGDFLPISIGAPIVQAETADGADES